MKVKKIYFWWILLIGIYVSFYFVKFTFGELTPDELFYTSKEAYPGDLSWKFFITRFVFSYLYDIDEFVLPGINLVIIFLIFKNLYKVEVLRENTIPKELLFFIFFIPSVLYLSSAFLRDIYVYLVGILLVFSSSVKYKKMNVVILFFIFFILRYEAGFLLGVSFILNYFITKRKKSIWNFGLLQIPFVILSFMFFGYLLFQYDTSLWNKFSSFLVRYEKTTFQYGILQLPVTQANVIFGGVVNWLAYYAPFLFKPIKSLFDYFIFIDSIIIGILFIRAFIQYKKGYFLIDPIYRISIFMILGTFLMAIPESVPETMFRHRMAYLPFLFYLGFRKSINKKYDYFELKMSTK